MPEVMDQVMPMPSFEETTVETAFENPEEEIVMSEKARAEVTKIMAANNIPDTYGLRVGVKAAVAQAFRIRLASIKKLAKVIRY